MIRALAWLRAAVTAMVIGYLIALAYGTMPALVLLALAGPSALDTGHALVLAVLSGPLCLLVGTVLANKRVLTALSARGLVAAEDATVRAVSLACSERGVRTPTVWRSNAALADPITFRGLRCAYAVLPGEGAVDTAVIADDLRSGAAATVAPAMMPAAILRSWIAVTRMFAAPLTPGNGLGAVNRVLLCWSVAACVVTVPAAALAWLATAVSSLLVPRRTTRAIAVAAGAGEPVPGTIDINRPGRLASAFGGPAALIVAATAVVTAVVGYALSGAVADTIAWSGEQRTVATVTGVATSDDGTRGYLADLGRDHTTTVRIDGDTVTLPESSRAYRVGDRVEVAVADGSARDLAGEVFGYYLLGGLFGLLLVLLGGWLSARMASATDEIRVQDAIQERLRATGVRPGEGELVAASRAGRLDAAKLKIVAPAWVLCFVLAIGGAWLGEKIGGLFGGFDAERIGFFVGLLGVFFGLVALTLVIATKQDAASVEKARGQQARTMSRHRRQTSFVQEPAQ